MTISKRLRITIKEILNNIILVFAILKPLDSNIIILANHGRSYLDSNNFFFLRFLVERKKKSKKIPFQVYTITSQENKRGNLNPLSIIDLFVILRAKTFLITHGAGDLYWTKIVNDKRRIFINLWHGTPVKAEGVEASAKKWMFQKKAIQKTSPEKANKMVFKPNNKFKNDKTRLYWIAASKLDRLTYPAASRIPIERCLPLGFPRDDLFFSTSQLDFHWENQVNSYISGFEKVILYAPTFRSFNINNPPFIPFLQDFSLKRLENLLIKHKAVFLYRYHINTERIAETFKKRFKSQYIKHVPLSVVPYTAYVLKHTDLLITDYSGVIYDFIPMDRPMIAFVNDFKLYDNIRGFQLNFKDIFPGKVTETFPELLKIMEEYLFNPQIDSEIRKFWSMMFRDRWDGKASMRVYNLLNKLLFNDVKTP